MKISILFFTLLGLSSFINEGSKVDFGKEKSGENWQMVNDGVMGGLSSGNIFIKENSLKFKGNVSLENNGGFASIRAPWGDYDLSSFSKITLKFRSKGIESAMVMETSRFWFRTYYKKHLDASSADWQTVTIPLKAFEAYRIGRKTGSSLAQNQLEDIIRFGFITDEKQEGAFELEVDWIRFE